MGELFQGLIQPKAHHRRERGEVVDGKENVAQLDAIPEIETDVLPRLAEICRLGCDLKAALPPEAPAFRQHLKVAGGNYAHHHVGTARLERFRTAFEFKCQFFHDCLRVELPITKSAWWLISPVRPPNKIVNAAGGQPVPGHVALRNAEILRALNHSAIAEVFHHLAVALESNWSEPRDATDSLFALFRSFAEKQICHPFLRDDVADVLAIDHHRRGGKAGLFHGVPGIEALDEGWLTGRLEGLHDLDDQLAALGHRLTSVSLRARLEKGLRTVSARAIFRSEIGGAAVADEAVRGERGAVALRVDLQGGADEHVGVMTHHLRKEAVRAQAAVAAQREDIRSRGDILLHADFSAKTGDSLHKT